MNSHRSDRLFAACGIAAVVLQLAGLVLGGKTHQLTVTSSTAKVAQALATPVGTTSWIGAYVELASFAFFLGFAAWATAKVGGGLLAQIARGAATSYATLSIASLGVIDALSYRAGHGVSVPMGRTLISINEALYVGSWFLVALFLLTTGLLALRSERRALGWSAVGTAVYTLAATPSVSNFGQFSIPLFLLWIIAASVALARGRRTPAGSAALAAQRA
jgi:hypothetical protein